LSGKHSFRNDDDVSTVHSVEKRIQQKLTQSVEELASIIKEQVKRQKKISDRIGIVE
jgi:hypothetical protein